MNGFAALDIHPHRRYVVDIGGRRSSRCRLHINFAPFLHSLDFTQNLGVTLENTSPEFLSFLMDCLSTVFREHLTDRAIARWLYRKLRSLNISR